LRAPWGVPTTSASATRTAPVTCPASVATRNRAARTTGASARAIVGSTTIAGPGDTARRASSLVAYGCARCRVIRDRAAIRGRPRCPVRVGRAVAPATSATRPRTHAQTTASVRETAPARICRAGAGPASRAPTFPKDGIVRLCRQLKAAIAPLGLRPQTGDHHGPERARTPKRHCAERGRGGWRPGRKKHLFALGQSGTNVPVRALRRQRPCTRGFFRRALSLTVPGALQRTPVVPEIHR
jgi:hypothetical protein